MLKWKLLEPRNQKDSTTSTGESCRVRSSLPAWHAQIHWSQVIFKFSLQLYIDSTRRWVVQSDQVLHTFTYTQTWDVGYLVPGMVVLKSILWGNWQLWVWAFKFESSVVHKLDLFMLNVAIVIPRAVLFNRLWASWLVPVSSPINFTVLCNYWTE